MTGDESKKAPGRRRRAVRRAGPAVGESATTAEGAVLADCRSAVLLSDSPRRPHEPRKSANSAAALAESAAWLIEGSAVEQPGVEEPSVNEPGTETRTDAAEHAPPANAVAASSSRAQSPASADTEVGSPESTDTDAQSGDAPARKLSGVDWAAAVVAVLSVVALLAAGALFVHHQRHADALRDRRAQYLQVAKQAAIDVTSIQDATAAQDIDLVLSVTSGELRDEYSSLHEKYAQFAHDAKIKAHGEVVEAAIESDDATSAQALVAVKETLTNAGSPDPQQRMFRLRLTLNRAGNGPVTASRLEFVP